MRAAWVLPSLIEGSGGHRTILQNVQYLIRKGYECDVYVEDKGEVKNSEELRRQAETLFGKHDCRFILGYDIQGEYDIIFATAWFTAKVVRDCNSKAVKAYFIQDFEALFNPMGDGYILACNSYGYGLKPVTIGRWLSHKMQTEYHTPSRYFDFCADRRIYRPLPEAKKEHAICFVYQPDKPRRCSVLGIEALGIVKFLRPDVKIYLYGSNIKGNVWFEHENLGIIPLEKCNALYNKCEVGLCISSSNPSRIPFEMMAAGLPVVDLYMENNFFDMPNEGVRLAHTTPESIAQALIEILDHPEQAAQMSEAGKRYMADKDLEYGFEQFYAAVSDMAARREPAEPAVYDRSYTRPAVSADVVMDEKLAEQSYAPPVIVDNSLFGRLKRVGFIRKSKLLRKLWYKLRGL
ncbi:glycosyl transferase family 1 [Stomatobaculum sp. F0698]|uniref:rhamnosyltransferase WsaF family glycosyltransferase n=1 Tax=Stomatobaculum sp. F0698 TaxID=3059030 RepID=UPI00272AD536|nr:glycosyl transferase family 1 [Stomatobaculum sp. F0698]WLD86447.1 glycosyl transferase family 1 [Stomatobaculum sp. F0698]